MEGLPLPDDCRAMPLCREFKCSPGLLGKAVSRAIRNVTGSLPTNDMKATSIEWAEEHRAEVRVALADIRAGRGPLRVRKFYLQRHQSGCVGNCLLWWAKGGNGYTCNIEEAEVFGELDPQFHDAMKSQEKYHAWEKSYIDDRTTLTVDHQRLEHNAWVSPEQIRKPQESAVRDGQ